MEWQAVERALHDLAGDAHLAVARRFARTISGGEAQHCNVNAHIVGVIDTGLLTHQLCAVVDALRIFRHVLRHRFVRRRAVFAEHWAVHALGAGINHAANVEEARGLQHVDHAHDVDLHAKRWIGCRDRTHEARSMHNMRHLVALDDVQ